MPPIRAAAHCGCAATADGRDACVDYWLAPHQLDAFGAPIGTVYAGGTPLFDEATGKTMSRLEHLGHNAPSDYYVGKVSGDTVTAPTTREPYTKVE